jgi:hypothetical protein
MMATARKFGRPMNAGHSGLRLVRRWNVLLAHDATAPTCDALVTAIEDALGNVDINDASSADDARDALRRGWFDVGFVCLDLPPAPAGGVRLAQEVLDEGVPLVLVTRSLRWIPTGTTALQGVPWIPPDADAIAVSTAVAEAVAAHGGRRSWLPEVAAATEEAGRRRAAVEKR